MSRDDISKEEWAVRCDLAACYRILEDLGWTDLIYTHVSARHPSEPDRYLINPYGLLFEEITASNLIVVDFDGNVVRGDFPVNAAGHPIHMAVLDARRDVDWVLHTHTLAGMAVSCMKCGLQPFTQHAMLLDGLVSYHDWDLQNEAGECERMAADLGPTNRAMILRNHGLLSCGPSIGAAFTTLYMLETACKVQVDVLKAGQESSVPAPEIVARTAAVGGHEGLRGEREWEALRRRAERLDPAYRS